MTLTAAQESAIYNATDNLVVVAGAGSGKTFVLVERYLALLDAHPDWPLNALVAITFTQKAAQEMRDRVRQHLQRQADEAEGEDAARWANRLAAMDSARIDTIHGLCATILRANAAEAGVDPGFEVLDEIEAGVLLDAAIDDAFRSLAPDDSLLDLFTEYGSTPIRAELKQLVTAELPDLPSDLFTEWLVQWVNDANGWIHNFKTQSSASERFEPLGQDALSERWQICNDALDWFDDQTTHHRVIDSIQALERIAALKLPGRVSGDWGEAGEDAKASLKSIRDLAKATLDAIGDPPGKDDERAARLMPLWFDLTRRVKTTYRIAKDEQAALDFDDLEMLTRNLLQDDAVRARYLGAEFKHVLVDEFQDTNAAQWAIIQRIADPALPGCLFVVGDPKQSIYGFRGADVRVFEQVRAELRRIGGVEIDLSTSFRTHRRLIERFNNLFAQILVRDENSPVNEYKVVYSNGMQAARSDAPSDAPPLELLLFDKSYLTPQPPLHRARGSDEEITVREWEARAIARRLKQMAEEERRPIFDRRAQIVRPMSYGDAALLFQATTHLTIYEEALKAEQIPYLTVAGTGYYNRQEVWDLLNLLRALYNPADQLSLAAALRSPLFGLSDDALLALRLIEDNEGKPIPLWDALDQADFVPSGEIALVYFARDTLRDLRRKAGRVTIADLLRLALDQTGYLAVLTGLPDGKRLRGNVEKLIDKAETSGRLTLSAFTRYLKDMSEIETREGEAPLASEGVVQLMTVHKSKGLEFPVVMLVNADYQRYGGASGLVNGLACKAYDGEKIVSTYAHQRAEKLAYLREEAERLRLLYVAATRAQDYLLISGQVTVKEGTVSARGWLGQLIGALGLSQIEAKTTQIFKDDRGDMRIDFPEPILDASDSDDPVIDWDERLSAGDPSPLLQAVTQVIDPRLLAAEEVADLGSTLDAEPPESRAYYIERFRRRVLHAAPSRIDSARWSAWAKVGDIVHRAVRWPLPETEADLRDLLRRYAWEEGIVDEGENRRAVQESFHLVQRVRRSDMFLEIAHADEVYRELPFVYQTERRTIHGIIDLLMRDADAQWRVVDYKTAALKVLPTPEALAEHAQRYHLQMGIYAAAVQELVGAAPQAVIHYVRYAQTVIIAENRWKSALAQLEVYIRDVIKDG